MAPKTQCVKIWDKYIYVNLRTKSCEINWKYSKYLVSSTCSLLITKMNKNINHEY